MLRIFRLALRIPAAMCVFLSLGQSQDSSLSLSPLTDSLASSLLKDPANRTLHLRLIDSYLDGFNPELALLELSYAEGLGLLGSEGVLVRGKTLAILEQPGPALRSLTTAYLQDPQDETLMLIAILKHTMGQRREGSQILKRLSSRVPGLPARLLGEYERYYLNGRRKIAAGVASAIRDLDTTSFRSYFPLPEVTILSPEENTSTEATSTSLIIEVNHKRPMQRVLIGGSTVYDRGNEPIASVDEPFSRSFTYLQPLREGRNAIRIVAEDILGFQSVRERVINGLNFAPLTQWRAALVDTLRAAYRMLRSYVPETDLLAATSGEYRALVVSGVQGIDSARFFERGMLLSEILSNPLSGLSQASAVKCLIGPRWTKENLEMLADRWLQKEATFRTTTFIVLAGRWRVSSSQWNLQDGTGASVDVKPMLESVVQLATAGCAILADGMIDDPSLLASGLRELVTRSAVPCEAVVTSGSSDWPEKLAGALSRPELLVGQEDAALTFTSRRFSALLGGVLMSNGKREIDLFRNPAAGVASRHRDLLQQTQQRLSGSGMRLQNRESIVRFCSDWRRYSELQRFVRRELNAADLLERAEEYFARKDGGSSARP